MLDFDIRKRLHTQEGFVNLHLKTKIIKGDFVTISGKSGTGKTTFLRILSGLSKADSGRLIVNGKVWYDSEKKIDLKPQKRKVGFVFQDFTLFHNMTVRENILYANNKLEKANELMELLEIKALEDRYPDKLSGGQKQRVAIARALAIEPEILLLDEPFSALDLNLKLKIHEELLNIHNKYKTTIILVSHDVGEIFKLSQRTIQIKNGIISKDGPPIDVFLNKGSSYKFSFVGEIISIKKVDIIYVGIVVSHNNFSEVVLTEEDIRELKIGDKVLVASKAFNPVIRKIKTSGMF